MPSNSYGFVGLGAMGMPMVSKALAAQLDVHIFDTNAAAVDVLVAQGAKREDSAAAVANAVETVFVSLPNAPIVEAVALGEAGLIHGKRINHYIDLSTTGPTMARKVGDAMAERGVSVLDAPVSGGPIGVRNETLAVMASGSEQTLERARPFLATFAKTFVHLGPDVGKAQILKLANNLLTATNMVIVGEALAFAEKGGIEPEDLFRIINAGSGRSWVSEIAYPKHVVTRRYDQNFRTELMHKDVTLCMQEAERMGVPMWLGANVRQFWQFAMTQGMADADCSRIAALIEGWAGLNIEDEAEAAE
ncbi:NAD(P)-dependent oxidoreductase [Mesorhizobium sp. BH1-1-4]|uniref:NAD(P)-dependent oxidoreductase n=1 Tax=Mesorhizobium sp. BH1-1-4 TaxID=2876662 RepID=UPI001CD1518C|nr:NAD(P)-dependent oxidoreductase [Mesorhizobium sp. BH1-1-4]MBZ9992830.1 NAD(P)-dependent oxidoreductase [Mesorhizobium sp. BH1-1-4]